MTDTRLLPSNGSVAAEELRGTVQAERFVTGEQMRITAPVADLYCTLPAGRLDRQLLFGDGFRLLERCGDWAFGQADRGGYVGYVRQAALGNWLAPDHVVSARATLVFDAPDFKTPSPLTIPLGARVAIAAQHDDRFSQTQDGRFIPTRHLRPIAQPETDPVAVAERLLGTPYLWGGNGAQGIDCSGVAQVALLACGVDCPGDSDLQLAMLPGDLSAGTPPQRGDLLFWKGHVALVAGPDTVLHANVHHMAVAVEPLGPCIDRIAQQGDGPVTGHKRLTL
ncbi:NlpC/P60 family protein [Actibacterium ureilyticum]|uniref:C40 family peptidase n=1 Tax=Actibacterium ureilyticum TaxID=1590614 RepID=UPI000BAB019C|nr:NlpC/P60 family protein [Actibacterium ureilyticum]